MLATVNVSDNLIRTGISPWPPVEILQKLRRSRQQQAFSGPDAVLAAQQLGFYCDLQSLNSEDAITWSAFGTLAHASPSVRYDVLAQLCDVVGVEPPAPGSTQVWLWRRLPHPETAGAGGPEIDFGFRAADLVVLGEAKWRPPVGTRQGIRRDRTQIQLRIQLWREHGRALFQGCRGFLVLGVSLAGGMLTAEDVKTGDESIRVCEITWERVCGLASHPLGEELRRYYDWKRMMSVRSPAFGA